MEQTSQQQTNPSSTKDAEATDKFINLRPFLRLRLGLFAVALALALLYVGGMAFGNGTIETPEPTDPVVAQNAWHGLVSDTLAAKTPASQEFTLPQSEHQSIGLLPVRTARR